MTAPEPEPVKSPGPVIPPLEVAVPKEHVAPKENGRVKSTVNLQSLFKGNNREEKTKEETKAPIRQVPDRPIVKEQLQTVWDEFAETRKHQSAEYQLLRRDYVIKEGIITISLSNPIEEPLLQTIRLQLTTFLRDKLGNQTISVTGILQEHVSKKVVYTSKEKFDHLAEKNPALKELKERLGLDTDF